MTVKKFPAKQMCFFSLFVCLQGENKAKALLMPLVLNEDKYLPATEIARMGKPLVESFWKVSE